MAKIRVISFKSLKKGCLKKTAFLWFLFADNKLDSLSEQISQKPRFVKLYLCHSSIRHQDSGHYQVFRYGL